MPRTVPFALVVLLFAALAPAQTGSINPTTEQLSGLSAFSPPEVEFIEEPRVDLRPWMPPVRRQTMNDCTAWALVYGVKSFAEARDQGWKPDRPERQFSPNFVYNQINDGADEGSNFVRAFQVMTQQGAATLAVAPYRPGDFTSQPDERARRDAEAFRIHDGLLVRDRLGIRRALQRRQPVGFGADVNPEFLGGRFEVYTRDVFFRDRRNRRPNQPHGKHAMVIVGYDDARQAFLVQNSWGTDWGQRGYCWVAYDLFDPIALDNTDENPVFCNWAVVMIDVEEPVERGPDGVHRATPLDLGTLRIAGHADFTRFDTELGRFLYAFNADLRGQPEALSKIRRVAWSWTDHTGQRRTITSENANARFGILGPTVRNPLALEADVEFEDGTTRTIAGEVRGPVPRADFRETTIAFEHAHWGMSRDNPPRPVYSYRAKLDYPLNLRDDILRIEWDASEHNTNGRPYIAEGYIDGAVARSEINNRATRPARITATITYADGGVQRITHDPVFDAEIVRDLGIEVETRAIGRDHTGQTHYAWTLALKRPREQDLQIRRVSYEVDPWLSPEPLIGFMSSQGFPVSGSSHRDFRVRATVEYLDGRTRTLERWVELAPDTRFPDANRVDLMGVDLFRGVQNGLPVWDLGFLLIGDRDRIAQIDRLTFHRPEGAPNGDLELDRAALQQRFPEGMPADTYLTDRAIELGVTAVFRDGTTTRLRRTHAPTYLANTAPGLRVDIDASGDLILDAEHQHASRAQARIDTPNDDLQRIVRVDWFHPVRGRLERTVHADGLLGVARNYSLQTALTGPSDIAARVVYDDGFEEYLTTRAEPGAPAPARPELTLRLREKFYRVRDTDGMPLWLARAEIAGDAHLLAEVASVEYHARYLDEPNTSEPTRRESLRPWWFARSRPSEIQAVVTMKDGRTHRVRAEFRAAAPRTAQPLEIRTARALGGPEGLAHLVWIDGWEHSLDRIRRVEFRTGEITDTLEATDETRPAVFRSAVPIDTTDPVTARVTLDDGTTLDLSHTVPPLDRTIRWTWQQGPYWGDGIWEVEARLDAPLEVLANLPSNQAWFGLEGRRHLFRLVGSWPTNRHRVLLPPGSFRSEPVQHQRAIRTEPLFLDAQTITVEDRPAERREQLGVVLEPVPITTPDAAPEWRVRLVGPERDLSRVEAVLWETETGGVYRGLTATHRWGEFFDGFEHRSFGDPPEKITARVIVRDGPMITLEWAKP